jgi:hypothetical protein
MPLITGIAHVNLTVPPGTLSHAHAFYGETLGFTSVPVPVLQKDTLAWYPPFSSLLSPNFPFYSIELGLDRTNEGARFDITPQGQQIHIAFGPEGEKSSRHPCFKVESVEALVMLQGRIWAHFEREGDVEGRPREADKPGERSSG